MNLKEIVSASGLPGLHRIVTNRNNGWVLEDIDTGKKKFVAARNHQCTLLENISIYTNTAEETIPLVQVFERMLARLEDTPLIENNASPKETFDYLAEILPEYDEDKVSLGDAKKIVKWFKFLQERNLLESSEEETSEETSEEQNKEEQDA